MDTHIQELQEKAFAGDTQAHEMYQEYVNRGQAPAIRVPQKQEEKASMYNDEEKREKPSLYGTLDPKKLHEVNRTPHTLMTAGYEALNQKEESKNTGKVVNFDGEKIDHTLSPMEKMSMGYHEGEGG
ncbi:hypothetical protein [Halobacillus sp. Cin3]|uniref:hypothetical protein n=1 Tax=Halobacillus sp. Cin3 TaxID=2928441 RepID=UPI00248DE1AF|nr:hypothetical protein [Halobacillus sp. Cin3]